MQKIAANSLRLIEICDIKIILMKTVILWHLIRLQVGVDGQKAIKQRC